MNKSMKPFPSIFPLRSNRVWRSYLGGREIDRLEGKMDPQDSHYPEDWLGSTTAAVNPGQKSPLNEGLSRIDFHGQNVLLSDFLNQYPEQMLGPDHMRCFGNHPFLLTKLLDSSIRLHVQCHPTPDFAMKHLQSPSGKAEGYVILSTRPQTPDPYIFLGFQRAPSLPEFRRAVTAQEIPAIESWFDKIPVKPGDVFFVPGGVPHAIGPGVIMVEIMEPTDFAVRIEFERGGYVLPEAARFMNRGIDFAASMFEFTSFSPQEVRSRFFKQPGVLDQQPGGHLGSFIGPETTDRFRVKQLVVQKSFRWQPEHFSVMIAASGSGRILTAEGETPYQEYSRFLAPYQAEPMVIEARTPTVFIVTQPPLPRAK